MAVQSELQVPRVRVLKAELLGVASITELVKSWYT